MTQKPKTALVIPTNRPAMLSEFLQEWQYTADWDRTIVVFDGPEGPTLPRMERVFDWGCVVYDWSSIAERLGEDRWIVSRQNAGVRIFGYLRAVELGAEVIATLDDDCRPAGDALMRRHLEALFKTPAWASSDPGLIARGVPYRRLGNLPVHINLGLWRGVGDFDAPHSLVDEADLDEFEPMPDNRVAARGQFVPLSTMNLAFRREALPIMYLPLMGQGQPFDRFDDIWGGIIAKRICDHLGWSVSIGRPIVDHRRASNPFRNLVKEAAGIERNETLWEEIASIPLAAQTAADCMVEIGEALREHSEPYFQKLGEALKVWARLTTSI